MIVENKNEIFGKRLKKLRNKKKMNQEKIAEYLGISRARYSHYENNHVEPDIELIRKIAEFHKVDSDYLLGITDVPNEEENDALKQLLNDPQTDLMFNNWKNMSEEEREEAIRMIEYIQFKKNADKKQE